MKKAVISLSILGILSFSLALANSGGDRDIGGDLLQSVAPSVFILTTQSNPNSGGTGFVLNTPSGPVTITNQHVCHIGERDGYMVARFDDGHTRTLKILKISDKTDLCMLEAPKDTPALSIASYVSKFERIHVIGHPLLEPNTHNDGHITKREVVEIIDEEIPVERCIGDRLNVETFATFLGPVQVCVKSTMGVSTSVVIYPGNSGSPALNDSGKVVGVWFAGNGRTNYGAFVPLDFLIDFTK